MAHLEMSILIIQEQIIERHMLVSHRRVRMDKSILLSCGSIVVYILQWCLVGYCEMGLYII
jgi:hypothetical protein